MYAFKINMLADKIRNFLYGNFKPNGLMRRKYEEALFKLFESKKLDSLKNTASHKRCFILGNGGTLRKLDLEKLVGEQIIVSNLFLYHELLHKLNPSYYCISDAIHWMTPETIEDKFIPTLDKRLPELTKSKIFLEYDAKRIVKKHPLLHSLHKNIYYPFLSQQSVSDGFFNSEISKPVGWGRSVVIDFSLPLAMHLGFKEIYIIGVDYEYDRKDIDNSSSSYFYSQRKDERSFSKSDGHKIDHGAEHHIQLIFKAFDVVKKHAESLNVKIFNATPGGRVENFPRVDFNSLF